MNPHGPLLEPPGPLLTHFHTIYIAYSERLPTRLSPLAERACFPQASILYKDEISPDRPDDAIFILIKVRKMPSWPRSWANFSLL